MCITKEQEDTRNWKCCYCLSLTVGTLMFGLGDIVGCIVCIIFGLWAQAAINGLFALPFVLILIYPKNPSIRKCLYILILVEVMLFIGFFLVGVICVSIYWSDISESCSDYQGFFETYYNIEEKDFDQAEC